MTTATPCKPSDKQMETLKSLISQIAAHDADLANTLRADLNAAWAQKALTGGRDGSASRLISAMITTVTTLKARAQALTPDAPKQSASVRPDFAAQREAWDRTVPQGARNAIRFALPSHTGNNDLDFYVASRRRNGYYSVMRQAGPQLHAIRWAETVRVLNAFAADPQTAGKAYADAVDKCYRCNLTLTDKISRQYGMGPDCRAKAGIG